MNPKYIYESFHGGLVYPSEIKEIKSKEDLTRWFEWTSQFTDNDDLSDLISKINLPYEHIKYPSNGESIIYIKFPRCKYKAYAKFFAKECYSVSCN